MSCFDGASPVWGPGNIWQPNNTSPATVYTEEFIDSYPGILLGLGYTCAEAKAEMIATFDAIGSGPQGNFGIIKTGSVVPAATGAMGNGGGDWTIQVDVDSGGISATTYIGGVLTSPWPARAAGSAFLNQIQFFPSGGPVLIQIPVDMMLVSFDFDAWWVCASGCVDAPRPTPRMGMQVLSNYTYSVINSFGQVPKI